MGVKKEKVLVVIAGLGLVLYGLWTGLKKKDAGNFEKALASAPQNRLEENSEDLPESREEKKEEAPLYVHVDGAVKDPGLYAFEEGERINDAIEKAGGLLPKADVSAVNLAQKLSDEMKVHIPLEGELAEGNGPSLSTTAIGGGEAVPGKVNINRASLEELTRLPSVGESRAREIIAQREKSPFQKPEDIMKVSGIGQKTFDKMKDMISVK